jgi:hypothetical protein
MAEAAGSVKIILAVDSTSYSAALDKAKAQLKQLEGGMHSAAATTKHEMTEAKGTIALLGEQIGVQLPRHIRSFIAELPGVASAMSAAFSAVAVVGIGLAIFEAGKKVYEFMEKTREAAEKNAEAWEKSRDAVRLSNLELDASTIHLQNELAKLEHKPENALAEELTRTAVEARKLDLDLIKATDDARKLLAEEAPSAMEQFITGASGTGYEQKLAKDHSKALREATTEQDQLDESVKYFNSLLERRNELEAVQAGRSTYLSATGETKQTKMRIGSTVDTELEATIHLQEQQADEQARIQGTMSDQAAKDAVDKEVKRKDALDAQKQAAEKQMQEWRRELEAVKAVTDFSVQQEAVYWQALADSVKHNSPLLIAATEEANKAAAAANKKYQADLLSGWIEGNREFEQQKADDLRISDAIMTGLRESQREIDQSTKEHEQAARANFENTAAEIEAAQKIGEESIKLQEQRGQLSRAAAALATEQLHATGAEEWRQAFGTAQNAGANFPLSMAEKHGAGVERQGEVDTATKRAATALGALQDSAGELAAQFTDIPAHVKDALNSTVSTINGAILRTLTDPYHRGQWKDAGKQIFSGMAGSGLKLAEGSIGKMIPGLSKLGATAATAMWTRSADLVGSAGSEAAKVLGKSATSAGSGIASFGGWLVHSLLHLQGGGAIPSGMPAVVGESGPELFVPSSSGRIVSNRTLNMAGGSVSHVINVDARGAGDPAAVEAAVHRTMGAYMAQLPAMTVETMRNYNARRPSGARV